MSKINLNRVSHLEFNMVRPFLKYPPEKLDALRAVLVDGVVFKPALETRPILSRLRALTSSFFTATNCRFSDDSDEERSVRFFIADVLPDGVVNIVPDLSIFAFKSRVSDAHARTLANFDFVMAKELTNLSSENAFVAVQDVFCFGYTMDAAGLKHGYSRQAVSLFCQNFMRTLSLLDDVFFVLNDAVRDVVSNGGVLVVAELSKKEFLIANGLSK